MAEFHVAVAPELRPSQSTNFGARSFELWIFNFLKNHLTASTIYRLTGVLDKMDANFPDGVTQIFSKLCNMKCLYDRRMDSNEFWSPDIVFPKKMTSFCLDLSFPHANLRLSQKVFYGNSCWYIFENTSNLIYKKSSLLFFSYLKKIGVPHSGRFQQAPEMSPKWGTPIFLSLRKRLEQERVRADWSHLERVS